VYGDEEEEPADEEVILSTRCNSFVWGEQFVTMRNGALYGANRNDLNNADVYDFYKIGDLEGGDNIAGMFDYNDEYIYYTSGNKVYMIYDLGTDYIGEAVVAEFDEKYTLGDMLLVGSDYAFLAATAPYANPYNPAVPGKAEYLLCLYNGNELAELEVPGLTSIQYYNGDLLLTAVEEAFDYSYFLCSFDFNNVMDVTEDILPSYDENGLLAEQYNRADLGSVTSCNGDVFYLREDGFDGIMDFCSADYAEDQAILIYEEADELISVGDAIVLIKWDRNAKGNIVDGFTLYVFDPYDSYVYEICSNDNADKGACEIVNGEYLVITAGDELWVYNMWSGEGLDYNDYWAK